MASYVRVPKHLLQLPALFRRALRKGVDRAKITLENGVKNSISERWHKTGASMEAAKGAVEEEANGNFRVIVKSGKPYDVFGEFGTGERGAADSPSFKPSNWNYGKLAGMKPRMAFHIGAEESLPDMIKDLEEAFNSEMNG